MNIFHVLSSGAARLHEPSMSAMLGYLLDSRQDHGLGDTFVRLFLELADKKFFHELLSSEKIDCRMELEDAISLPDGRTGYIDIKLSIFERSAKKEGDEKETFSIYIENKIKPGAANSNQLKEYYDGLVSSLGKDEDSDLKLFIVFLTPDITASAMRDEFENLELRKTERHGKKWIFWAAKDDNKDRAMDAVVYLILSVLQKEIRGEINPINEYMRHTLKAFNKYALDTIPTGNRQQQRGGDIGNKVAEVLIQTSNGQYRLIQRDSMQIQIFDKITDDKLPARPILRQFVDEKCIITTSENPTTRQLGAWVFNWCGQNGYKIT